MDKFRNKIEIDENVPIRDLTTYKTTGNIKTVIYPKTTQDWQDILEMLEFYSIPYFIIGNGSNLLISPQTRKIAISTKRMQEKIKINKDILSVSANLNIAKIFQHCKQKGLSGFEALAGIPASIGGAIKNNASCFGCSIFDNLKSLQILKNGQITHLKKSDIFYSYHKTNLTNEIILSAKFQLKPENPQKIQEKFVEYAKLRQNKQPKGFSCGSVFKNPEGLSAGFLIEKCNLKGKKKGDGVISEKHGNFIININNATFDDIKYLIEYCEEEVRRKYGINLEREVEIIE